MTGARTMLGEAYVHAGQVARGRQEFERVRIWSSVMRVEVKDRGRSLPL
jgi:hypothetical protein